VAAVKRFFRRATAGVEERVAGPADHRERISAYLLAVAEQLRPTSPAFFADERPPCRAPPRPCERWAAVGSFCYRSVISTNGRSVSPV
jgi:hypothetical protein